MISREALIQALDQQLQLEFMALPAEVQRALIAAAALGSDKGIGELNITDQDMIAEINAMAKEWAENRAAEMVGMKWINGQLMPNPDAKWSILETTRSIIKDLVTEAFATPTGINELAKQIEDSVAFSPTRAEMVARTEIKNSATQANYDSWVKSGYVTKVSFQNSSLPDVCQLCIDLAEGSPYDINNAPHPVRDTHPNCRCVLIAVKFSDEAEKAALPVVVWN